MSLCVHIHGCPCRFTLQESQLGLWRRVCGAGSALWAGGPGAVCKLGGATHCPSLAMVTPGCAGGSAHSACGVLCLLQIRRFWSFLKTVYIMVLCRSCSPSSVFLGWEAGRINSSDCQCSGRKPFFIFLSLIWISVGAVSAAGFWAGSWVTSKVAYPLATDHTVPCVNLLYVFHWIFLRL